MAYSYIQYAGNGTQTDFSFSFPYFNTSDISVLVNGVSVPFTWMTSSTLKITTAPASGAVILIKRTTPKNTTPVNFVDGSVLLEADLDTLAMFALYAAQESIDTANLAIITNGTSNWEAQGKTLQNLGDPVNTQDAVTKGWALTGMASQLAQAIAQASAAATSAGAALSSQTAAAASAAASAVSAAAALVSQNAAAASLASAMTQAANALASATAAAASAAAALTSQNAAAASASTATTQATAAASSASSAATSATTATTQASNASASASSTAALLAAFRGVFLGAFVSDAAAVSFAGTNSISVVSGLMYENTTITKFRIYNGSAWVDYDASAAASQSAASLSAASAAASASTATTQATNAATSATTAAASQTAAAASATSASSSASTATTQATNAATSATSASTSATTAAASQTSAAASLDAFKKNYQGALATAPTTRYDSSALQVGDLYFNTTSNAMFVRSASGWSPAGSSVNGTSRRYRYIATAAQTTFTGSDSNGNTLAYDSGFVDVYLNGSRLDQTDFTATSGSSIVLSVGANAGEELNIVAFGTFSVAAFDGSGLNAGTVSYNKIQNVTAGKVLGRDTSGSGVVQELPIAVDTSGNVTASGALKVQNANANLNLVGASNVAGTTSFDLIQAADSAAYIFNRANGPMIFGVNNATQARLEQSGDFRFNSGYGSVATAYGCRAWISMVGTGTISIRGSANVSSIVDDAVGNYTVNFTSAMPDTNYSAVFGANGGTAGYAGTYTQNTGSIKTFGSTAGGFNDLAIMNMAIFR